MSAVPEQRGEVESLLAAAKRDSLAFNLLSAQPEAPTEVMFFLAQQEIEKARRCRIRAWSGSVV